MLECYIKMTNFDTFLTQHVFFFYFFKTQYCHINLSDNAVTLTHFLADLYSTVLGCTNTSQCPCGIIHFQRNTNRRISS